MRTRRVTIPAGDSRWRPLMWTLAAVVTDRDQEIFGVSMRQTAEFYARKPVTSP